MTHDDMRHVIDFWPSRREIDVLSMHGKTILSLSFFCSTITLWPLQPQTIKINNEPIRRNMLQLLFKYFLFVIFVRGYFFFCCRHNNTYAHSIQRALFVINIIMSSNIFLVPCSHCGLHINCLCNNVNLPVLFVLAVLHLEWLDHECPIRIHPINVYKIQIICIDDRTHICVHCLPHRFGHMRM